MPSDSYYYLSALPTLPELGNAPPIGFAGLMELVGERQRYRTLVGAIFLWDDLVQREAFLAGELAEVVPAVLSVEQASNQAPLPPEIAESIEENPPSAIGADRLWEAYFRHVASVAKEQENDFLVAWVGHEVALRNALASARARRLGLEESDYLVATDLASEAEDFSAVVSEWAAAATPLAGLRVLLRARWAWIAEHDAWFTFRDDEMAAYAARLMLLDQWRRLAAEGEEGGGDTAADTPAESLERNAQ